MLCWREAAGQTNETIPPAVTAAVSGSKTLLVTWTLTAGLATKALKGSGPPAAPAALARSFISPAAEPRVTVAVAMPEASELPVAGLTEPPPLTTCQVTAVPATGLPPSVTITRRGPGSTAPARPACPSPLGSAFETTGPDAGPVPPPPQAERMPSSETAVTKRSDDVTKRHGEASCIEP